MDLYWIKTNKLIKRLFSNQVWDLPNTQGKIYLTFDDGPTPEITDWILEVLRSHNIKATFFCIGNNIRQHPDLFKKLIQQGHAVGNHTHNHLQGWRTPVRKYLENIRECQDELDKNATDVPQALLFRPPYGKIRVDQSSKLRRKGYKIIMWDVLSADFDTRITPEQCLRNVTENTTQGSIIVFHDSVKAFKNLEYTLPKAIEILKEKGFKFDTIR